MILAAILIQSQAANTEPPDEPIVAASTAPDEPSPTPSPSPSPSAEPIAIPTPDTTGRDFDRIFRDIVSFEDWLFQHPDQGATVDLIYHIECECRERTIGILGNLEERGLVLDGGGLTVQSVELAQEFESVVRLRVQVNFIDQEVRNEAGEVVDTIAGSGDGRYSVSLVRISGRWLMRTVSEIGRSS